MTPQLINTVREHLFSTPDVLEKAKVNTLLRQRLIRLREGYLQWLNAPQLEEKDMVSFLRDRHGIGLTVAYEDLRLIKVCLGSVNQVTKDYDRYLFRCRAEEGFRMAREQGDARAFAAVLSAYGKYAGLDKAEADMPAYSDIVPVVLTPTDNPEAIGIRPIKNWRERAKHLHERLTRNTEFIDIKEINT